MKKIKNSPRKKPNQSRSENLVQSILTAATRILTKKGFEGSTTNHIAELAGVSIGSLYQYFPNKESLVGALIDQQLQKNLNAISKKIEEAKNKTVEDSISFLVDEVVTLLLSEKGFFKNLFVQALRLNRVEPLVKARGLAAQLFLQVLEAHASELRSKELQTFAFVCTNAVLGVLQISALNPEEKVDREVLKKELSVLVLNYIRA